MSVSVGVSPVDLTTSVGMVRTLLGDTDSIPLDPDVPGTGEYKFWSDAELTAIIAMFAYDTRPSSLMRVAVWCLRQVAVTQSLLLKVWTSDDLAVNGAAITESIRKVALDLEKAADTADANDAGSVFTVTDTNTCAPFTWVEGMTFPYRGPLGLENRYGYSPFFFSNWSGSWVQ